MDVPEDAAGQGADGECSLTVLGTPGTGRVRAPRPDRSRRGAGGRRRSVASPPGRSRTGGRIPASRVEGLLDEENERVSRALARELHDRVANDVSACMQLVDLCRHRLGSERDADEDLERTRAALGELEGRVRTMIEELREPSRSAHGPLVAVSGSSEGLSLSGALHDLLARVDHEPADVRVEMRGDDAALPAAAREQVFLVLQEAVRNALAHARASRIDVTVEVDGGDLRAAVEDDGVGITVEAVPRGGQHIGLSAMRERVDALGGVLCIASGAAGTRVDVEIPGDAGAVAC